jgi:threonine/homoserine/homoserine lactone efflux protein
MATSSIAAFWVVTALLVMVPGADWAFTISAGVQGSSVVAAIGGILLGYAGMTAVVAAGVGALVARSAAASTALTLAGGVYLIWCGIRSLANPATIGAPRTRAGFVKGIGVSGLNPKGLLLFLAVLPQFTNRNWSWPVAGQIGVLGLVFIGTCGIVYLCVGLAARFILRCRPAAARVVSRISGMAMTMIGVALLAERLMQIRAG